MAKKWTIMFYMASSGDVKDAVAETLLRIKQVGSTNYFDVFAQIDSSEPGVTTKRYHLQRLSEAFWTAKGLHELEPDIIGKPVEALLGQSPELFEGLSSSDPDVENRPMLPPLLKSPLAAIDAGGGIDLATFLENILLSPNPRRALQRKLWQKRIWERLAEKPDRLQTIILNSALVDDAPHEQVGANAGRPEVLKDFIESEIGKAEHTMVILWGHGDGFSIAGEATLRDRLRPEELAKALDVQPRVDITGFNSCLMSMIEVYHALSGVGRFGVGSEGFTPDTSWPYDRILGFLDQKHGQVEPDDLARYIVETHVRPPSGHTDSEDPGIDLSACDVLQSQHVAEALGRLVELLLQVIEETDQRDAIIASRLDAQTYQSDYVDLYHFCELLSKNSSQSVVREACYSVMGSITNCGHPMVIRCEHAGDSVRNSYGVSIYFPSGELSPRYRSLNIKEVDWKKFLKAFLKAVEDLSEGL
jgi:hypothetical protein